MTEGHTRAMRSMAFFTLTKYVQSVSEAELAVDILSRTGDPYLVFIAEAHLVLAGHRRLKLEFAMESGTNCFERSIRLGEDASAGLILMTIGLASGGNFPFAELSSCLDLGDGDRFTQAMLGLSEGMWHLHHRRWEKAISVFSNACQIRAR